MLQAFISAASALAQPTHPAWSSDLFDLLGRRIVTLASGVHAPGRHTVAWDRRSAAGSRVAPGIYTCRLIAGEHRAQQRIIAMP